MKTKISILIYLFINSLFCFSQTKQNKTTAKPAYQINVQVKGLKSGKTQFAYYYADKKLLKDSAEVDAKGNFTFSGNETLKQGVYMVILPGSRYFELIINENQTFSLTTDTVDYVKNMVVKGNDENTLFYQYLNFITPKGKEMEIKSKEYYALKDSIPTKAEELRAEIVKIDEEVQSFRKNFIQQNPTRLVSSLLKATEEPDIPEFKEITDENKRKQAQFNYYKQHYFDNLDLSDDRMLRTPVFHPRVERYIEKLTVQMPDSVNKECDYLIAKTGKNLDMFKYMLIYLTGKYEKSNIMCLDEVPYHLFDRYFLNDKRVDWIDSTTHRRIQEEVVKTQYNLCGDVAQELAFADTTGKVHKLSQVSKEYTVVYFWSATCGHCKKTTPKLQELYDRIKDEYDLEVYSVCIDKEDKEFKEFIRKYKFSWLILIAPENKDYYREKYNVYSTPIMYLLNHKKEIIGKKLDVENLEKMLQELTK